jgi:ABC-type multidrug transport system fused ATPase/permease subunit
VVGTSGAGKSTLFEILLRFYDISEGEVLIDGINIKNYDIFEYRKIFGLVNQ